MVTYVRLGGWHSTSAYRLDNFGNGPDSRRPSTRVNHENNLSCGFPLLASSEANPSSDGCLSSQFGTFDRVASSHLLGGGWLLARQCAR